MSQLTGRTENLVRRIGRQRNKGVYRAICRRPNGVFVPVPDLGSAFLMLLFAVCGWPALRPGLGTVRR